MAKKSKAKGEGEKASRATAADLLARAEGEQSDREKRRLRAQAEALAREGRDWAQIAEAHAAGGDDEGARRCLERALSHAGDELWVYRNAARVYAERLGDRPAAERALEACFRAFSTRAGTAGYEWQLLAEGFVETLGDRGRALACLENGRKGASEADALCSIASGYVRLGDRQAALELLDQARAKARAEPESGAWWSIANTFKGPLGDDAAARQALEEGRDRCSLVSDLVPLASAFASHQSGPSLARSCLEKAITVASTADEWVDVAEGFHQHLGDRDEVRRCLGRALSIAGDDDDARRRIADGLRRWLGEAGEADRVSPSGLRPEVIVGPLTRRLEGFEPDPSGLFDWLRARVDDPLLERIARADYGSDAGEHLAALREIRDAGLVPHPLAWHPREVLELTRWSEGDRVNHLERAFCCAVLTLDDAGPRCDRDGGPESSLAPLVESCQALGEEALARLLGHACAMADVLGSRESGRVGELFARLALLLAASSLDSSDSRLGPGVDRLFELERLCHEGASGYENPDQGWLFGLSYFDQRADLWRTLIDEQAARCPALRPVAERA